MADFLQKVLSGSAVCATTQCLECGLSNSRGRFVRCTCFLALVHGADCAVNRRNRQVLAIEFVDSPLVQKSFANNMCCRTSPDLAVINRRRLHSVSASNDVPHQSYGHVETNFPPSSGNALDVAFYSVEFEKGVTKPLVRQEQKSSFRVEKKHICRQTANTATTLHMVM
ncbi:hypothetical protein BDV41DRAFT_544489 [Aspergillus transmontanensis]|uniref:Uncharacterized protein n=1 Tax=Aspergillus transmontanensis TaxID=1034304 RepID=A0A5N6VQ78_9EURO|nr:hypothetical protein BDV41DRAFT_544489 [Aspergillus transmontanensis]